MRTAMLTAAVVLTTASSLSAQTIHTFAGTGKPDNNGVQASPHLTNIGDPFGVEFASDGSRYICEVRNHRVWSIGGGGKGELALVAGDGTKGSSGTGGPAVKAQLNEPYEVRIDTN